MAMVGGVRVEVAPEVVRERVRKEAVAVETRKFEVITEMGYNKNVEVEYDSLRFVAVNDTAFDLKFEGATRKGPGEIIAEFTAAIRY